jgi:sugar phosphate isomerase/epimerase
MRFGFVGSVEQCLLAKTWGFEFVEELVPRMLQPVDASSPVLPILAAGQLLPDGVKITGPDVELSRVRDHVQRVCELAERIGVKVLAFDCAVARHVPEGFDRKQAKRQILEFLRTALPFCARHGIMLVCQPLSPARSNIINTLPEALQYVWEVDHPNFQCLLDVETFLGATEPLENLRDALPWIRHVHLPAPSDPRAIFAELKRAGYDGLISVTGCDANESCHEVLAFLKKRWADA